MLVKHCKEHLMKYPDLMRAAMLAAAALGAGSVLAQATAPSDTTPAARALNPQVVSDVAPAPAEDRTSSGALVVAPVRAQRGNPTATMGAGPSPHAIGHRARRTQVEADLERARLDQEQQLKRQGAAGQTAN
jgi:hypothetical protein